jgi:hypothetical protein
MFDKMITHINSNIFVAKQITHCGERIYQDLEMILGNFQSILKVRRIVELYFTNFNSQHDNYYCLTSPIRNIKKTCGIKIYLYGTRPYFQLYYFTWTVISV